ncbi:MAG TPA: membrane protein insertase YidC [Pirellulales bacterium]|nr:membrane protein insertase YidC [Pirellulales bacterium]
MENRRFIIFIIGSIAILIANFWFWSIIHPPAPPQPAVQQAQNKGGAEKKAAENNGAEKAKGEAQKPNDEVAPAAGEARGNVAEAPEPATQHFTLGSADTSDKNPYRLLVMLTNQGAAVERIELSDAKYRDLENHSGYLGHLAAENAPDGAKVNVVAPGTPAAIAGLLPDDVISAVDKHPIADADGLEKALKTTSPGQQIELAVLRSGQPQTISVTLGTRPLEVVRPELFTAEMQIPQPLDIVAGSAHDPLSFLFTFYQIDKKTLADDKTDMNDKPAASDALASLNAELPGVKLRSANWEGKQIDADTVEFARSLPKLELEVVKRYRIAKDNGDKPNQPAYHLTLEIELRNIGSAAHTVSYQLDGPTGLPTEGWWYTSRPSRSWGGIGVRDTALLLQGKDPALISPMLTESGKLDPPYRSEDPDALLVYAGVDAQYVASALLPTPLKDREPWLAQIKPILVGKIPTDPHYKTLGDVSCRLVSVSETLKPGAAPLVHTYTLFAGPKQPDLLAQYPLSGEPQDNLGELVYYGWPIWAAVARPMTHILHFFYGLVGNYGLAIIMLTVLVRGCMYPLTRKQAASAQKMQELKPELDRINEKYKGKAEEKTRAMQELYRKNNFNPMAGCMLAFVQLPIFIGLYRSLMINIDLRQAPLLGSAIHWCSNLAAPDMLWYWKDTPLIPTFLTAYRGFLSLGPYLNILPIFTVTLFIIQQQMFMPPATDDQTRTQQKMMKYMLLLIAYAYYTVPSGLCLYIISSSIWGIAEKKLLPKTKKNPDGTLATVGSRAGTSASGNGAAARRDRKKQRGR